METPEEFIKEFQKKQPQKLVQESQYEFIDQEFLKGFLKNRHRNQMKCYETCSMPTKITKIKKTNQNP